MSSTYTERQQTFLNASNTYSGNKCNDVPLLNVSGLLEVKKKKKPQAEAASPRGASIYNVSDICAKKLLCISLLIFPNKRMIHNEVYAVRTVYMVYCIFYINYYEFTYVYFLCL